MNDEFRYYMEQAGKLLVCVEDIYHHNDLYPHMEWNIKQAMLFIWED